jgi:hypothetical protein
MPIIPEVGDLVNNQTVISKNDGSSIPRRANLDKKRARWKRISALIENDEDAFKSEIFCHQLPNEKSTDYYDRRTSFPVSMVNPSQELITSPGDMLFQNGVKHEVGDNVLAAFTDDVTKGGDKIPYLQWLNDYVTVQLRAYGNIFTVVDKPRIVANSRLEELSSGMPYLTNIHPLAVHNYEMLDSEFLWFMYMSKYTPPWIDPRTPAPQSEDIYCVWTRKEFIVMDADMKTKGDLSLVHNWGFVPVVHQASFKPDTKNQLGASAFEQTSNMIIQYNNFLNIWKWELYKHAQSLMLMHEESIGATNMDTDQTGDTTQKKQARGTVLAWGGEHAPQYLVKDLAVDAIQKAAEFWIQAAVENERDMKSVIKKGGDGQMVAESGFAKIMDREPLEANLCSLAEDCESYTEKVYDMVAKIMGVTNDSVIEFDKDFDIRSMKTKLEDIEKLISIKFQRASISGIKEAYKGLIPEITTDPDMQATIQQEIDDATMFDDDSLIDEAIQRMEMTATGDGGDVETE